MLGRRNNRCYRAMNKIDGIIWELENGILDPYQFIGKLKEYNEENKELMKLLRTKYELLRTKYEKEIKES